MSIEAFPSGPQPVPAPVCGGRRHSSPRIAQAGRPLISVVTVVYNSAARLRETISSVMAQSRDGIEYVVVDGGSTDGTLAMLQQFDHEIDDWSSERDGGIYDAMNKALSRCHGEYVHFLNAGDTFCSPDVLRRVSSLLAIRPALLMNRVKGIEVDGRHRLLPSALGLATHRERFVSAYCHQGAFVRTDLLRAVGFDASYKHFADFYALMRIRDSGGSVLETTELVVNFPLDGVSSNWRKAPALYAEKERMLAALGEANSGSRYLAGWLRAQLYRVKMTLRAYVA